MGTATFIFLVAVLFVAVNTTVTTQTTTSSMTSFTTSTPKTNNTATITTTSSTTSSTTSTPKTTRTTTSITTSPTMSTTAPSTTTTVSGSTDDLKPLCEDTVPDCHTYVKDELCNGSFKLYGAQACRKTCSHCIDSCIDEISNCSAYNTTTKDMCNSNYTWSFTHCERFCGFCGVLGNSCNKEEDVFCKRIEGASCKGKVCTCDAGFRPLADIECEAVYWKKCNATHGCDGLENAHCEIPSSPGTTLAPWTNTSHCLCKPGYVYIHENHSCDADCGNLKAPQNGSVNISEGTTFGSKANYSCDIGYTLYGSNTAECEATGNWSNHYVNCTINDCGNLTSPENGFVNISEGTTFGSNASYSCNTGYTLNGSNTSECEATGNWSDHNVHCTIKNCNDLPTIHNGTAKLAINLTTYGAQANVTCNSGFYTDTPQINCTQVKDKVSWSNSTCEQVHAKACLTEKDCSRLPNSKCGNDSTRTCVCKVGYFYNSANYSCDKVLQASCNSIGNKSLCTRVLHAKCGNNGSCICGQGFEMKNGTSCVQVFNKTCDGVNNETECLHLEQSVCTNNFNESNKNTTRRIRNTQATCQCRNGYYYHFENDTHVNCLQGCRAPNINNTFTNITNITSYGTLYKQGDGLEYNCVAGYIFQNTSTLPKRTVCRKNGTFEILEVCCKKDCGNLKAPQNGSVYISEGTTYGSKANYSCDIGYTLYGSNTDECESTGNWSNHYVNCTINDCGMPNQTVNGNVSLDSGNKTVYLHTATYICESGYGTNDSTHVKCNASGLWSSPPPNCTDINECENGSKCNEKNSQCVNFPGGYRCNCKDGWTGTYCNDDIDECRTYTAKCHKWANCTNFGGTYSCQCKMGFNDISPSGTGTGRKCEDIDECRTYTAKCHKWANCTNFGGTYSCQCKMGFNDISPSGTGTGRKCEDIDECRTYTAKCHKWANCTNFGGTYSCQCKMGFNDISPSGTGTGRKCEDKNECAKENLCNPKGSLCVNYPGHYRCDCNDGWTGTYCKKDIDECNNTNTCGIGAHCNNFEGGYTCTCNTSLPKGNPKVQCYENVIIKIDTKAQPYWGDNQLIDAKPFQHRFPYFGEGYTSYRPYMDGFVALAYQPIYESYGPEKATEWKEVTHGYTVIAPLWTNIASTNITGGLYVHYFDNYSNNYGNNASKNDLENLRQAFAKYYNLTDFEPRQALVATWENVTMSSYIPAKILIKTQNASMQMILISDGIHSYIMFNYDQELWSLKIGEGIPSSSGYSLADKTGFITATSSNYSELNNGTNVTPVLKGRWIYNVSSTDISKTENLKNETECLVFGQNSTIKSLLKDLRTKSNPCPCSEVQIQYDYSFHTVNPMYKNSEFTMICYEEWFFNDGVKQTCCYRSGALEKDNIGGGFATFEPDTYHTTDYFYKCCGADGHLCHIFYEMNPSDDCSRYNPADEPINRNKRSLIGYLQISSDISSTLLVL